LIPINYDSNLRVHKHIKHAIESDEGGAEDILYLIVQGSIVIVQEPKREVQLVVNVYIWIRLRKLIQYEEENLCLRVGCSYRIVKLSELTL